MTKRCHLLPSLGLPVLMSTKTLCIPLPSLKVLGLMLPKNRIPLPSLKEPGLMSTKNQCTPLPSLEIPWLMRTMNLCIPLPSLEIPWLMHTTNLCVPLPSLNLLRFFFLSSYPCTFTTLTIPSTVQPVHLFLSYLYSFALLFVAARIASPLLFHHSYVFFPSSYAVPLGLCAFSCSINTASVLM